MIMIMIMNESVMEYTIDDKRYIVKDDKCTVILFAHLISSPQSDSSYLYGYPRISKDPQGTTAELVVQPLSWRGTSTGWSEEGRTWAGRREVQGCGRQGRQWNRLKKIVLIGSTPGSWLRTLPTT